MRYFLSVLVLLLILTCSGFGADWTQWGGSNDRNMVSSEKSLPETFEPGEKKSDGSGIDMATTRNVKWAVKLGNNAYGNPTVANGKVFVGTDARVLKDDKRFDYRKGGVVMCFDEETGDLLWKLAIPVRKIPREGIHFGLQRLGICSSAIVEGNRAYLVTSAADIVCIDIEGQANGNDGPFMDEAVYMAGAGKEPVELNSKDGDIIWRFDPVVELGVAPHDAASCSVVIHGDIIYTGTSNGLDKPHANAVSPFAPSVIALDKKTGNLVAVDEEKIGLRMYHAQWSSPSVGEVGGKGQVFFGGGDGICYAFEAFSEVPENPCYLKKVWSFDCNPKEYKYRDGKLIPYYEGDKRKSYSTNENDGKYIGPSTIIATPVFYKDRIYLAIGQDPAHGRGKGMFYCIDATKTGDITNSGTIWKYDGLDRSMSTVAVKDGLVYVGDVAGRVHCLDAANGQLKWVYNTDREMWGGPLIADGKIYIANKGRLCIFKEGDKAELLSEIRLGNMICSTPIAANGVLYVASGKYLYASQLTQ